MDCDVKRLNESSLEAGEGGHVGLVGDDQQLLVGEERLNALEQGHLQQQQKIKN